MSASAPAPPSSFHAALQDVASHHLFTHTDSPFSCALTQGHPQCAVVVGDNASGKSLWVRVLAARAQEHGLSPMTVSIRERTGSGFNEMAGMRRAMMYGDEQEQSTGATSFSVMQRAWSSASGWHQAGRQPLLIFDEPEMGLSESYTGAMGEWLGDKIKACGHEVAGVVVVTHARALVQRLEAALGVQPTIACLPSTLSWQQWCTAPGHKTPADLEQLQQVSRDARHATEAILETRRTRSRSP